MSHSIPNILTIAGVDPSGGAGVLADVKAISALGGYACAVIAALTAQNTRAVAGVLPISPSFVGEQLDVLLADVRIDATKIGMVVQAPVIVAVADLLLHWAVAPVVLDPVMVAKSGDPLLDKSAVGPLREALLPLATVITPNLPEAGLPSPCLPQVSPLRRGRRRRPSRQRRAGPSPNPRSCGPTLWHPSSSAAARCPRRRVTPSRARPCEDPACRPCRACRSPATSSVRQK